MNLKSTKLEMPFVHPFLLLFVLFLDTTFLFLFLFAFRRFSSVCHSALFSKFRKPGKKLKLEIVQQDCFETVNITFLHSSVLRVSSSLLFVSFIFISCFSFSLRSDCFLSSFFFQLWNAFSASFLRCSFRWKPTVHE